MIVYVLYFCAGTNGDKILFLRTEYNVGTVKSIYNNSYGHMVSFSRPARFGPPYS